MKKTFRVAPETLEWHRARVARRKGAQRVLHLPDEVKQGTPHHFIFSGNWLISYLYDRNLTYHLALAVRDTSYDADVHLESIRKPPRGQPSETVCHDAQNDLDDLQRRAFPYFLQRLTMNLGWMLNKTPYLPERKTRMLPVYQPEGIWKQAEPRRPGEYVVRARATIPQLIPQLAIDDIVSRHYHLYFPEVAELVIAYTPKPRKPKSNDSPSEYLPDQDGALPVYLL